MRQWGIMLPDQQSIQLPALSVVLVGRWLLLRAGLLPGFRTAGTCFPGTRATATLCHPGTGGNPNRDALDLLAGSGMRRLFRRPASCVVGL